MHAGLDEIVAQARATPGVTSAVPLIEQPLAATYNGRAEAVLVRGMRVDDIRRNSTIQDKVLMGSLQSITQGSGRIAIGSRLAESLGALEVGLTQDDLARMEEAVPVEGVAGERYHAEQMAILDSERD